MNYNEKNRKQRNKRGARSNSSCGSNDQKSNKTQNSDEARYEEGKNKSGRNDASWYAQTPQLLSDSASLSYSWPVGNRMRIDDPSKFVFLTPQGEVTNYTVDGLYNKAVSGVMGIEITPTIGRSSDQNSAVNTAARNIYSFVRHANSGHANYEASDLMMYLLAMDNLYSSLMYLQRTYGLLQLYSVVNRYYPLSVINTCRLDAADLLENLADFRYFINNMAVKIGSLCVPNTMPYMARHLQLYSSVYLDDDQPKAQSYIYFPRGFYQYNELTGGAGQLDFVEWGTEDTPKLKFSDIVTLMNNMCNAILASEDMNIMSGDILKAYGYDKIVKISTIPEDFIIVPEYNAEILTQISNLDAIHSDWIADWTITQDTSISGGGAIINPMQINPNNITLDMNDKLINFKWTDVKPEQTMVASRLMAMPYKDSQNGKYYLECGSEICTGLVIVQHQWTGENENLIEDRTWLYSDYMLRPEYSIDNLAPLFDSFRTSMKIAHLLSQFDFHPLVQYGIYLTGNVSSLNPGPYVFGPMYEISNYSTIGIQTLRKMHETALLSEFNVVSAAFVGNSRF